MAVSIRGQFAALCGVEVVTMRAKDALGQYGESLAARRLEDLGMTILDRNWRGTGGELDIVALDGTELVIVEVKTRSSLDYGHPAEAVTVAKMNRIRRLTGEWTTSHEVHVSSIRVDIIAVIRSRAGAAQVEHLVAVS